MNVCLNELDDKNSNEEDLINKYKEFDPLTQKGIYYYSSKINKDILIKKENVVMVHYLI